MTELINKEINNTANIYLSVIKRDNNNFTILTKWFYILFTRFRAAKENNPRYIITRYYLSRVAKKLGFYSKFNYCFSHSGAYSAVLFSSESDLISVDIERVGRKLPASLRLKVRSFFPELLLSELKVIMILESLVKFQIPTRKFSFLSFFSGEDSVQILPLRDSVFEVNVNNCKVYSKIYTFAGLYICITLESDRFNLSL